MITLEHYSRDRVLLRILNTVFFAVLLFINIRLSFFSGDKSFVNYADIKYFMSPYKFLYILNFVSLLYMAVFVIVQIDSSSHGIKKKVVENYSFFLILAFIFMGMHLYFLIQKKYSFAFLYIIIGTLLTAILYIKSQNMKRYMYNDEIRVFVYPFSVFFAWNAIMLFMTFNIMFKSSLVIGSTISIILAFIQLIIIVAISIGVLYFFRDTIFIVIQLLYLLTVAVNTGLNDYFMPVGYLCFLSIILVFVFLYRTKKRKK
ncbi:hypothetical protein [Peptoanaerobacter stomatis]|uniref:hypothetical protein n=1 Tax=Peptoanaerobacter stomatis TaxID=796937 RepID=UPI00030349B5|nr:hypothetical protein [Peptoanaerobacter stomatis]